MRKKLSMALAVILIASNVGVGFKLIILLMLSI